MKKIWKIVGIIIATVIGLLALGYLFMLWAFAPGDTKELEDVANRFEPDPSWVLESKKIYPERKACLEANCNSLYYSWTANESISRDQFEEILEQSNFSFDFEGDCDPTKASGGSGSTICEANAIDKDYEVRVYISASSDDPHTQSVILYVNNI